MVTELYTPMIEKNIKILVAVDGSEHSMRAAQEAIRLAKLLKGSLTLVHIIKVTGSRTQPFHWHQDEQSMSLTEGIEVRDQESLSVMEGYTKMLEESGVGHEFVSDSSQSVSRTVLGMLGEHSLLVLGTEKPVNHVIPRKLLAEATKPVLIVK